MIASWLPGVGEPHQQCFSSLRSVFSKKMVDQSNFEEMELDARILFWRKDTKTLRKKWLSQWSDYPSSKWTNKTAMKWTFMVRSEWTFLRALVAVDMSCSIRCWFFLVFGHLNFKAKNKNIQWAMLGFQSMHVWPSTSFQENWENQKSNCCNVSHLLLMEEILHQLM